MTARTPRSVLQELQGIREKASEYYKSVLEEFPEGDGYFEPHDYWADLSSERRAEGRQIAGELASLAQRTGPAIRRSFFAYRS